jgi:hypothetical protein
MRSYQLSIMDAWMRAGLDPSRWITPRPDFSPLEQAQTARTWVWLALAKACYGLIAKVTCGGNLASGQCDHQALAPDPVQSITHAPSKASP